MTIAGTEGLSHDQLLREIDRGGRFVVFQYCISVIILTFKRESAVHFIRAGESAVAKSLPYTLLSLAFGWWGFPFGLVFTPWAIIVNLRGGRDVTHQVLRR